MQLTLLRAENALRLSQDAEAPSPLDTRAVEVRATIDVSSLGRILGIELRFPDGTGDAATMMQGWTDGSPSGQDAGVSGDGTVYIELTTAGATDDVRSVETVVTATLSDEMLVAVTFPRRGHGYEIAYPSGNR